jgi:hypothetical protein
MVKKINREVNPPENKLLCWEKLPQFSDTANDWTKVIDPYLALGLATEFWGFKTVANQVVVTQELKRAQRKRIVAPANAIASILKRESANTTRFELGLAMEPKRMPSRNHFGPKNGPNLISNPTPQLQACEILLGVIDDTCPFAHIDLRNSSSATTRVLAFWDQSEQAGSVPTPTRYGKYWSRADLNQIMASSMVNGNVDEIAVYKKLGDPKLLHRISHGSHVAGIFAASSGNQSIWGSRFPNSSASRKLNDKASGADLIFVRLPDDVVQSPTRGAQTLYMLDAIEYMMSLRNKAKKVVVVCDYGSVLGPHDSSDLFSRAFSHLKKRAGKEGYALELVLPTGNAYEARTHTQLVQKQFDQNVLELNLPPGNETPALCEIWIPSKSKQGSKISVQIGSERNAVKTIKIQTGETVALKIKQSIVLAAHFGRYDPNAKAYCVLIQFGATSFNADGSPALPFGAWQIKLKGNAPKQAVHSYISKGGKTIGAQNRSVQARFSDNQIGWEVKSNGTLTGFSCATSVYSIAGVHAGDFAATDYSGAGPARRFTKPIKPNFAAIIEEGRVLRGIRSSGNLSTVSYRLIGTSAGAPKAGRELAQYRSLEAMHQSSSGNNRAGNGVLDYYKRLMP